VEPFAGGGIVSLTAVFEGLADRVILVELDKHIASVWQAIIGGEAKWLADRILNFSMTYESLVKELNQSGESLREMAFKTLLLNRTSHGGIMAPGAGLIKNGENGKGITSRWYPSTIAKRILNIDRIKDCLEIIEGDGLEVMHEHKEETDTVFFIDPPYTAAGKKAGTRLYNHSELNHESLFTLTESLKGEFLMTYDNAEGVREMATQHGFSTAAIPMKNTHHAKIKELLISRNLGWVE